MRRITMPSMPHLSKTTRSIIVLQCLVAIWIYFNIEGIFGTVYVFLATLFLEWLILVWRPQHEVQNNESARLAHEAAVRATVAQVRARAQMQGLGH